MDLNGMFVSVKRGATSAPICWLFMIWKSATWGIEEATRDHIAFMIPRSGCFHNLVTHTHTHTNVSRPGNTISLRSCASQGKNAATVPTVSIRKVVQFCCPRGRGNDFRSPFTASLQLVYLSLNKSSLTRNNPSPFIEFRGSYHSPMLCNCPALLRYGKLFILGSCSLPKAMPSCRALILDGRHDTFIVGWYITRNRWENRPGNPL